MRIPVVLNRESGALRAQDPDSFAATVRAAFQDAGMQAQIDLVQPHALGGHLRALKEANAPPETIVVGGGDGSVSTAARELVATDIALGVLPLGTFNLFARALGMPLEPGEALATLLKAMPTKIDTVQVNDRMVLQHASIGVQPRLVQLREKRSHSGRVQKLFLGTLAWLRVLRRPQLFELQTMCDDGVVLRHTPAVLISNNRLREGLGAAPVSATLQEHRIAVYVCTSARRGDLVKLTLAASLGLWRETGLIEEIVASEVKISSRRRHLLVSFDGELERIETPLTCRSRPASLTVLMP